MLKTLITLLALFSASAFAGDASTYQSLGFSDDGKYFAFVQYGIQDGSGFPYANAGVIDVAKNAFVVQRNLVREEGDPTPEQVRDTAVKELKLSRYQISPGMNPGQDLLVRLPTDLSEYKDNIFALNDWSMAGSAAGYPRYSLLIEEKAVSPGDDGWCTDMGGAKLLKLSLASLDTSRKLSRVLQEDRELPRSRACTLGYSVSRVTKFRDSYAVILRYRTPGFEGRDYRFLAVTVLETLE